MKEKLYTKLARTVEAYHNCAKNLNDEWMDKHEESIIHLVNGRMPHGSGIDNGITLDIEKSTSNKLVFLFSYHFMDENGYYAGWEDYKLTVTSSLAFDIEMKFTGKNRNDIKEYFYQIFEYSLTQTVE